MNYYRILIVLCFVECSTALLYFNYTNNVCNNLRDYIAPEFNRRCYYNPDVQSSTPGILSRHGYPFETHFLQTEDGYVLNLYRIPHDKGGVMKRRQVVYFQHGSFQDSSAWVSVGKRSIAFKLVQKGYDVWLGNTRGNSYSNEHVFYNPIEHYKYWPFTLDELGQLDLPAIMEYVTNVSKPLGKIIYIGHSQGTTISYIYAAGKKKHAEKHLAGLISLAPIAYLQDLPVLKIFAPFEQLIQGLLDIFQIRYFGADPKLSKIVYKFVCQKSPWHYAFCFSILNIFLGPDKDNELQPADYPIFFSYATNRQPVHLILHLYQLLNTDNRLMAYNYGTKKNLKVYGQRTPPEYKIGDITVPVFMYYGTQDLLSYEPNVLKLYDDVKSKKLLRVTDYNHIGFIFGKNLETMLYPSLFDDIEKNLNMANDTSDEYNKE